MFESLNKIGTRDCRIFAARIFNRHVNVDQYLKVRYIRQARSFGCKVANQDLMSVSESLIFNRETTATMDDEAIKNLSVLRAKQCEGIYIVAAKKEVVEISERLIEFCESVGVEFPLVIRKKDTELEIMKKIICAGQRVSCEKWWRRQLRVLCGRQVEGVLRSIGFVRSGKSPYVSNWALGRWKASQSRNRKTMERLEAVTRDKSGEEIVMDLQACIDASVSNPENRRNELMVRMRGYEEVAAGLSLDGLFFTLTAPSSFHAMHVGGGTNHKFSGASPLDTMDYLNGVWSRIRAEWAKKGIKVFGFRVAEPHHDGTPHFHFLLFVNAEDRERVCDIFGRHALAVDGDERGALEYRWNVKVIDPAKGSAAGYIAKYVAKNLDGYAVDVDEEGECMGDEGAARARAWASMWGIRQFQQIGSVSVTVWRELRRQREAFDHLDQSEIEPLRAAADCGDWAQFVALMGGAFVSRDNQPMRPAYHDSDGSAVSTRYGEPVSRLIGVWLKPVAKALGRCLLSTREHVWTIREKHACGDGGINSPPLNVNLKHVLLYGFKRAQPSPLDLCQ